MSKLNEQDQARIAAIEKDLLKLKLMPHNNWLPNTCLKNCGSTNCKDKCIYSVFWESVAPIAPVEPNTIAQTEPIKEEIKYFVHTGSNEENYEVLVLGMKTLAETNKIADKIKQLLTTL